MKKMLMFIVFMMSLFSANLIAGAVMTAKYKNHKIINLDQTILASNVETVKVSDKELLKTTDNKLRSSMVFDTYNENIKFMVIGLLNTTKSGGTPYAGVLAA